MALFNFYGKTQLSTSKKTEQTSSTQQLTTDSDCLFFKKGTHYQKVALQDILWLQAESNYTTIFTQTEKYTYSCVLKHFEDKLPANQFVRVHRSYIVNICNVSGLEGNSLLIGKKRIPVSKTFSNHIFDQFKTL
jgi:DNA-binding LytR/AlgR family response regulator